MLKLDASLRVASLNLDRAFVEEILSACGLVTTRKEVVYATKASPTRKRTELRDHLDDGFSVTTSSRKRSRACSSGSGATLQRSQGFWTTLPCFRASKHWTTCLEYRFRVPKHINLLEAEAARQSCATSGGHRNAISKSAGRNGQSCLDERAGKGTFSSRTLNYIRKQLSQTVSVCEVGAGTCVDSVRRALTLWGLLGLCERLLCCRGVHCASPKSRVPLSWVV